ncbi:MAG: DNA modification methylase [Acidobacteriia bacterium]|nr:DNA modification methylase [Terriglobia bacterium]
MPMAARQTQTLLFPLADADTSISLATSSTFVPNMGLPVHRWFRYSAGFSADWVESVINSMSGPVKLFDPFAGSATTLLAAESVGVEGWGLEAHPFVYRVARAKLSWRSDPQDYLRKLEQLNRAANRIAPDLSVYPSLIRRCYGDEALTQLDVLRQAYEAVRDESPASELLWLTLVAILRRVSTAGTAQWQYILPKKQKRAPADATVAFQEFARVIHCDMQRGQAVTGPRAHLLLGDARTCNGIPQHSANLVITSPPYPNNYDYADATRLEMSFMREISGWGDLQEAVRKYLVCSCSQHVPENSVDLSAVLQTPELSPIRDEIKDVCEQLAEVRESKGGRKTYHLMIARYFRDLAQTWKALRSVCTSPSRICFVIGDSAPYGVYVPVIPWLGRLAISAGFKSFSFEKTRDRNVKWKNRKHRVPLQEGHLWIEG